MRGTLLFVLALVLLCAVAPSCADEASCGKNCFYSLNLETKVLTISGQGEMERSDWAGWEQYIRQVIISPGITNIMQYAFDSCTALSYIFIPDTVQTIQQGAFDGCSSLSSISIPSSVQFIGNNAFERCSSLTTLTLNSTAGLSNSFPNSNVHTLKLQSHWEQIRATPFSVFTNLQHVTLPDNVKNVDSSAFDGFTSLQYASAENGGLYLGSEENPNLVLIKAQSTTIESCIINQNTKVIANNAFADCSSLTKVTLKSAKAASLFLTAFNGLPINNLEVVNIPAILSSYFISYSTLKTSTLKTLVIGSGVFTINSSAFSEFAALKNVTIGPDVTVIDTNAFSYCQELETVTFGENLNQINEYAFTQCSNLQTITIPASVNSIEYRAFYNCTSLQNICYLGSKDPHSGFDHDSVFTNCPLKSVIVTAPYRECGFCGIHQITRKQTCDAVSELPQTCGTADSFEEDTHDDPDPHDNPDPNNNVSGAVQGAKPIKWLIRVSACLVLTLFYSFLL